MQSNQWLLSYVLLSHVWRTSILNGWKDQVAFLELFHKCTGFSAIKCIKCNQWMKPIQDDILIRIAITEVNARLFAQPLFNVERINHFLDVFVKVQLYQCIWSCEWEQKYFLNSKTSNWMAEEENRSYAFAVDSIKNFNRNRRAYKIIHRLQHFSRLETIPTPIDWYHFIIQLYFNLFQRKHSRFAFQKQFCPKKMVKRL